MYTITFYSFKGGVGRTMALANVGVALARAGRRVLLVDFDLEAPGLDTFDLFRADVPSLGVVDYITEYRESRIAPDVSKFLYEAKAPSLESRLWVMPTGKQDENYGNRLNTIDWNQLYQEEDGYLLFEDLKEQWARQIRPDYVLIDSRTGHTDVGGICTRQLPDAVVLLFFPNEQNRRGLEVVVRDIRQEPRPVDRLIDLYFVAANVPDLDDEEGILRTRLNQFEQTFQHQIDSKIHHYDSLSLVQQQVFTQDRPRTKLAREYERLSRQITSRNLEDRTVVSQLLERISTQGLPPQANPDDIEDRLKKIHRLNANNGAVLYALAQANDALGKGKDAKDLFDEAAQHGFFSEEKLLESAVQKYTILDLPSARVLVSRAMKIAGVRIFVLDQILTLVAVNDPEFLRPLFRTLDSRALDVLQKIYLVGRTMVRRETLPIVEEFLRSRLFSSNGPVAARRGELALCLIAQGKFEEAQAAIESAASVPGETSVQDTFNYAMATWGKTGKLPSDLFAKVLTQDGRARRGANYMQCLAIAHLAVGQKEQALEQLRAARSAIEGGELEFSAWRYLRVPRQEFIRDLEAIETLITTGVGQPAIAEFAKLSD